MIVISMSVIHQGVCVKMVVVVPTLMEASLAIVQPLMVVLYVQISVMHVVIAPVLEMELVSAPNWTTLTVCVHVDGKDYDVKTL